MTEEIFSYDVKCRTCYTVFKVQLFDSHEKNLFVVDKKSWYCAACKKKYLNEKAETLSKEHESIGFPELTGTEKMVSWAVSIRSELINKVDYLKSSLKFEDEEAEALSNQAFELFFKEWHEKTEAKWWVDNRRMNVRSISQRVNELKETIKKS